MMSILSRQEKIRSFLETFCEGRSISETSRLTFFPNELERFRKEFPQLVFEIKETSKTPTSKRHIVEISFR